MAIPSNIFRDNGGFREDFPLPILEDVEFSHRLRRAGYRLIINPEIAVRHIFNFSLFKSLRNAMRKSMHWTIYSIGNRDLFVDSGTASIELKANVFSYLLSLVILLSGLVLKRFISLSIVPLILGLNLYISRNLIRDFYETKGLSFAIPATLYYMMIYPLGVAMGVFAGILIYLSRKIREMMGGRLV